MNSKFREKKLANVIRKKISTMILEGDIKDPRLSGLITITDVECSKDLKYASIYISVIGTDEEKDNTIIGLNSAKGFIKNQLSNVLTVRWMPEIIFKIDNSIEKGVEMYEKNQFPYERSKRMIFIKLLKVNSPI